MRTQRRAPAQPEHERKISYAVALIALIGGVLAGWTVENALTESFGAGGWLRSLALATLAIAAPLLCAAGLAANISLPSFDRVLAARDDRVRDPLVLALGLVLIALCVLAVQAALVLVFDPRYRDFPFAPLTAAAAPFLLMHCLAPRPPGIRAAAETLAAGVLALCALYVAVNETPANWQALWFCAALLMIALNLARVRVAQS
jgi:glucan 1,3-beta-glucosidase